MVVDELAAAVDGGLIGSGSGRFFAWVIGGALPSAVATEWLMSAWDQNAAIYATSPASSVVEEVAGKWLLDLLRLPAEASFGFTTGLPDRTLHGALGGPRSPASCSAAGTSPSRDSQGRRRSVCSPRALHHVSR